VPDITLAQFIDKLRAAQVCVRAGAQTIALSSDKNTIAKVTGDAAATWREENAQVAIADPTFGSVVLQPKSLAVIVKASRELIADSINIDQALETSLRNSLAAELDRVALIGSGVSPEPTGIFYTSGVNSFPGLVLTDYDDFISSMALCWEDNSPNVSAIVMSPGNFATLAMLKEATTNAPLAKPEVLRDVPILQTTSVGGDKMVLGDFSQLIIGIRLSLRIEILREIYAEHYQVAFLASLRADIGVQHAASFCKITVSGS
jgi:HK97 family phage major capsid protein